MASVTIAGGGIAALETVLALRAHGVDAPIEMLAPKTEAAYRPLAVLEPFSAGETPALDLRELRGRPWAYRCAATRSWPWSRMTKTLVTGRGERLPFELLLVAAGARAVETLPGALVFRGYEDSRRLSSSWTRSQRAHSNGSRSRCRRARLGRCLHTSWASLQLRPCAPAAPERS